jgi:hypothetical protein
MIARASSNRPIYRYEVKATGISGGPLPNRWMRDGGGARCRRVPEEGVLVRSITITISKFDYNPSSRKWDRPGELPDGVTSPVEVGNVPEYPVGEKCKTPRT